MKKLLLLFVLILSMMNARAQTCSAPIALTIMNGNMYRFYTDTVPGIQSYAWIVTTFEDDTATSTGSFSSTPSAYFSGSTFNSPDYVEVCLTLTFDDGCVASSCDTFIYCDAGFTYTIDNQYGLTLTPDFPAGYMNELHYWTLTGPGISNPTQTNEVSTYYVAPGQEYTACQQLMITSTGCIANECQVITIPSDVTPYCDPTFTYDYLITNGAVSVNSNYYPSLGNFLHTYTAISYFNDNTTDTVTQNNGGYFFTVNPDAYAVLICHTITNLNTACSGTACEYLNLCTAGFSYLDYGTAYVFSADGIATIASHSWTIDATLADGSINTQILDGPIATWVIPYGATWAVVCHDVTSNNPVLNCTASFCDTLFFCNAEFTINDNFNGTFSVNPVSPPTTGAVYTWSITGPGYPGTAYSGSYFNFTPVPNEPYYVCMAYFNDSTGCSASNCDTILVEGSTDSCSAAFTYTFTNDNFYTWPINPYIAGNSYSYTVESSVYGTLATNETSSDPGFVIPLDAGTVSVCLSLTNEFNGCNETFCDTMSVSPDTSCTADIVTSYGPGSLPVFTVNGGAEIATYNWNIATYDSNGTALEFFSSMQSNASIPAGTVYVSIEVVLGLTFETGCVWNGWLMFTGQTDTLNGCNANFNYTAQVANPLEVVFDASMSIVVGNNPSFTWDFGDGTIGTGTTVSHTYALDGLYTVCLTAYSDSCSNTSCGGVYAGFTDTTAICDASFTYQGPLQPDSYQFSGLNVNSNAYHLWTFGDGTSSNLAMPIHSYASPGNYEVCHIVGVDGVCADTVCNTFYFGLYLAGTVSVGANCMDFGSVKLYSLDTLSNSVELIGQFPMYNNLCYYDFIGLTPGVYLVRAGLSDSSTFYNDYVPTYFGSQYYWFDAEPIYLTQSGGEYNISLIYGSNPGGNGTVGGSIDDGPFRLMDPESAGVESSNPVAGAKVIVTNLSGNPQRWMDADDSGNFNIDNLAYGTYRLLADEPGMTCVPIEFTISPDFPSVFIEIVMGEELTGIESNSQVLSVGDVYPNPSQNNTFLKLNSSTTEEITIQVIGLDGKMVFQSTQRIAGNSVIEIPSSTFAPGMYFLRLNANDNGVAVNRKLQIVR